MADDADLPHDIEAKLHRLRVAFGELNQSVVEQRLHMRRIEEKLDAIILKLFEPDRLRLHLSEQAAHIEATATPGDVDALLETFLAARRD